MAPFRGALGPSSLAISPINCRRILMISKGLVTICSTERRPGKLPLLQTSLIAQTYDLTTTCRTTGDKFPKE